MIYAVIMTIAVLIIAYAAVSFNRTMFWQWNPLDAFFGMKKRYTYVVQMKKKRLNLNMFPGDEYELNLMLTEIQEAREHGPQWARKRKTVGYVSHWSYKPGIPISNTGGRWFESSLNFSEPTNWVSRTIVTLNKEFEGIRKQHGYVPTNPLAEKPSLERFIALEQQTYGHPLDEKIVPGFSINPEE